MANDGTLIFDTTLDLSGFNSDLKKLSSKASQGVSSDVMAGSGIDTSEFYDDKNRMEQTAQAGLAADVQAGSGIETTEFYNDKNRMESTAAAGLSNDVEAGSGIDTSGFVADAKKMDDVAKDALKQAGDPFNKNGELEIKARIDTGGTKTDTSGVTGGILKADMLMKAGEAVVSFGKDAVDLASDLEEVQNVVDVTFEDSAAQVDAFAASALDMYGITELQAKRYSGTLGAMIKTMGLSTDEALLMSTSLAGLTGDIASFYNLDHEDAFEKIRSGISGETEPLKQLGINMSVANLEAYALAEGIEKSYEDMEEAEKALLRYNYLMDATTDVQGDFSRTYEGFANQSRLLQSNLDTIAASVAEKFLPSMAEALVAVNNFLGGIITGSEGGGKTELENQIDAAAEALGNVKTNITDIKNNYAQTTLEIDVQYQSSQELLDDYEALSSLRGITEEEFKQMQSIVSELVGMYPEVEKYVAEDGLLAVESLRVRELIGSYADLAKQKAYSTMVSDIYAQYLGAEFELEMLNLKSQEAEANLADSKARLEELGALREEFAGLDIVTLGAGTTFGVSPEDITAYASAMQGYIDVFETFDPALMEEFSKAGIDIMSFYDTDTGTIKNLQFEEGLTPEAMQERVNGLQDLVEALTIIKQSDALSTNGSAVTALMQQIASYENALITANAALSEGMRIVAEAEREYNRANSIYEEKFGEKAHDAGKQIVEETADGVESQGQAIETSVGKINERVIKKFLDEDSYYRTGQRNARAYNRGIMAARMSTITYATSHATGLSYVPYNNYKANLHVGEAVLTAAEAQRWRSGQGSGGISADELMAVVSAAASASANRPIALYVDGRLLAEVQATNNRTAISARNKEIALGVGLK